MANGLVNKEASLIDQITEDQEAHAKRDLLVFWLRMIAWIGTAVAAPISVFSIKFGLFTQYGYQVTTDELGNVLEMHTAINGWGIVSVVLTGVTILTIIHEVIDAYSEKYSFVKQCLVGIKNRIIPIAMTIFILYWLKGVIDQAIFCLVTIGISQAIAIPLNPLPKWKAKVKGQEDYSDILTGLRTFLKRENNKGGK